MKIRFLISAILPLLPGLIPAAAAADDDPVERGAYLVKVSGCNDCHTPGYLETDGRTPKGDWLTGSTVGFQGPWGTTYPANLRLYLQGMDEAEWLVRARQPMRPPMPWFNLAAMTDADLLAVYRFIRALGPAGQPAPVALGPAQSVKTAYIEFVPKPPAH